jgi:hypothetical protein
MRVRPYDASVAPPELVEGRDYYVSPNGLYVFTTAYLSARGYCCRCGCRHCPYGFTLGVPAQEANGDPGGPPPSEPSPPAPDGPG